MPAPQVLQASQPPARAEILMNMCSKELSNYPLIQLIISSTKRLTSQNKNVCFMDSHGGLSSMLRDVSWVSPCAHTHSFSSSFVYNLDFLGKPALMNSHLDDKKTVLFKSFVPHFINHLKHTFKIKLQEMMFSGEGKCCVWSHSGKYDLSLGLFSPLHQCLAHIN